MSTTKKAIIGAVTVAVVAVLGVTAWLLLKPEGTTTARGTCGAAIYEFEAESDDGVVEVTFELQSSAPDETWDVRVEQDGGMLLEGERRTDADGELDVDAIARGDDAKEFSVVVAPTDAGSTADSCTATLTR